VPATAASLRRVSVARQTGHSPAAYSPHSPDDALILVAGFAIQI
jgi:hypothetical protein